MTGSMPGIAASTSDTWLFGAPPNSVDAPENSFDRDETCACTSIPTTTSQSPVVPRISFPVGADLVWTLMAVQVAAAARRGKVAHGAGSELKLASEHLLDRIEAVGEAAVLDELPVREAMEAGDAR